MVSKHMQQRLIKVQGAGANCRCGSNGRALCKHEVLSSNHSSPSSPKNPYGANNRKTKKAVGYLHIFLGI
jgi:hypothetical protein